VAIVRDVKAEIDPQELIDLIEQRQKRPVPQAWRQVIDEALVEAVGDGIVLESAVVASLFGGAPEVVLMAFTIGRKLEDRVDALSKGSDVILSFTLDIIGSLAVSNLGKGAYSLIEGLAAQRNTKASIPLNPGTTHWPMSGQRVIAEATGAGEAGIEALASGVLRPYKTLSFAVALGDSVITPAEGSSCDYCENRDACRI
jgi:hypothetical protein